MHFTTHTHAHAQTHTGLAGVGNVSQNSLALLDGSLQLVLHAAQLSAFVYLEEHTAAHLVDGAPARHHIH